MKKVLIALMSVALLGGMSSCNKWLDVDADTRVGETVMFANSSGMRIALNGIYNSLGEPALYGQELTWALASCLGRDYPENKQSQNYRYMIYENEWYENYSRKVIDPVWKKAYNTLANINNLLQAVEKTEPSFFEWGQLERNMFLAELRGLRALIHFDMLRLFAPAPINDDGKTYIPYVEKYPDHQPKKLTVNETMDKIEADLLYASALLVDIDTSSTETDTNVGPYGIYAGAARFGSSYVSSVNKGQWFALRGTRMNYLATTALLARLYMWKGDKQKIFEPLHYIRYKKWYSLTSTNSWTTNSTSPKLHYDFLMAAYNTDLEETHKKLSKPSTTAYFQYDKTNFNNLYSSDPDDYRGKLMNTESNDTRSLRWIWPTGTTSTITNLRKDVMPLAPIIKLSEVYLMMMEALADTDLSAAITMMEQFRAKRGAKRKLNADMTKEEFLNALELEYVRDFQSEGQTFFYYKRLNKPVYQGEGKDRFDYSKTKGCWVLQQPLEEDSYSL
ncbi:MAG: RagB/SusD family nutrient uptake outer membrane protein [Rikenellaceae bacterium]|nr:RagB/SusD family nutrient uptake outer membrane protein [Rikenellaceae bacterium]